MTLENLPFKQLQNGWNSPAGRHVVSCLGLLGSTMNEERPNPAGDLDVDIRGMDGWMDEKKPSPCVDH